MTPEKIVAWVISGLLTSMIMMVAAFALGAAWALVYKFGPAGLLIPAAVVAITPWVKRHIYDA